MTADFRLSKRICAKTPPNHSKRLDVQLQERLLGLHRRCLTERRPGERRAHHEQVHRHALAREIDLGLAPVDLRLRARLMVLRHEHVAGRPAELPLARRT